MSDYEAELLRKIDNKEELTEDEREYCALEAEEVCVIEGETSRWSRCMTTIFKLKNWLFLIEWDCGLTECQEDVFYEDPCEVISKERVITKTVTDYIRKEDSRVLHTV